MVSATRGLAAASDREHSGEPADQGLLVSPSDDSVRVQLATLRDLLSWNLDRPSRAADALVLSKRALARLRGLHEAAVAQGAEPTRESGTERELAQCTRLLESPWQEWSVDRQVRLAEQILRSLEGAASRVLPRVEVTPRPAVTRWLWGAFAASAVLVSVWILHDRLFPPPHLATRMSDLATLRTALGRHFERHGHYPVSQSQGREWNGIGWHGGEYDWIPGLAPTFVPQLPRDPRHTPNPFQQYVYRSDGKDFKLLVLVAEDCERVLRARPEMGDDVRNVWRALGAFAALQPQQEVRQCNAYGFWTPGATFW